MGCSRVLWFTAAFLRYTSPGGGVAAAAGGEEQDHWEEDSTGSSNHPGEEQAQLRAHWTPWSHGYQRQEDQRPTEKGTLTQKSDNTSRSSDFIGHMQYYTVLYNNCQNQPVLYNARQCWNRYFNVSHYVSSRYLI